jgi:uncharacterized protein YxeA
MKKLTITIICLLALSFAVIPVGAQTRARYNNNTGYDRRYDQRSNNRFDSRNNRNQDYRTDAYGNSGYRNDVYDNSGYRNDYQNGSVWNQHRDKITTAGGAVAGALLGSLAGGKRGAIIGAIAGGGGAALYTYKIRNKDRRY